jgi:hypothetical protein
MPTRRRWTTSLDNVTGQRHWTTSGVADHALHMSELEEAARVRSSVEAQLIVGMLEAHGITAIVSADDAGGLEPQLQLTDGVRVLVPRRELSAARALISESRG